MFLKKIYIPTLIFIASLSFAKAQQFTVTGTVSNQQGEKIPGVTVFINENTATTTDDNGTYRLTLVGGTYLLKARLIGFANSEKSVTLEKKEVVNINFVLQSSSTVLNTVVVSAGKFAQKIEEVTVSMNVIKPTLIENTANNTVETAIEQITGVNVNDGQANIRGGSGFSYGAGSRVLVLVDDMPMLSADANDAKWSFLPIENLEQIEVIKGASSALYGSSAMNGVINFRTGYAKSEPVTSIISYSGFYDTPSRHEIKWWGNQPQLIVGSNMYHAQKLGQFDLVLGGHYFFDNGFRKGETEKRARINTNLRYRFKKIDGLSVGVNVNYMDTYGGLFIIWNDDSTGTYIPSGGVDTPSTTLSNYHTIRYNIDPFISYASKKGFSVKWRSRYFKTDNYNDSKQEAFADLSYSELQVQQRFDKWNLTLTGGAALTNGGVQSDLYGSRKTFNKAVYVQADKKFFDRLNLSAGWRWEEFRFRDEKPESKPVYRFGANMRVAKATFFRTSYGQGYRFPSIAEKFVKTRVGSIVVYPNDSVHSEQGWSAEVGLRQVFKVGKMITGYIDVAFFRSQYKDMLEFTFGSYGDIFTDPLFGLGFKSVNIGNTRIDGMEYEAGFQMDIMKDLNLKIGVGYTYIDPELTDFDTLKASTGTVTYNFLKYRYRNLFKGNAELEYKKLALGLTTRYNSFMENIDVVFNELIPGVKRYRAEHKKGDWVYDARLAYQVTKSLRCAIIARNLFNREYMGIPSQVEAPRTWFLQFAFTPR
jgi:iron complex outermembrane receptor protein